MAPHVPSFQIFRLNFSADNLDDFQGEKVDEFTVKGSYASGNDDVSKIKTKLREKLSLNSQENLTLYFNGRCMKEKGLFYADHFIILPAWVQVLIHSQSSDKPVTAKINELQKD